MSNGKVAGKPSHVYYVLCNHAHTSGPGFVDAFYILDRIWYPAKTESLGQCVCPFIAMFAHVVASRKMQIACNQRVFRLIIMRIFFSCIFFLFLLARNVPSAIRIYSKRRQRKQLDPPGGFSDTVHRVLSAFVWAAWGLPFSIKLPGIWTQIAVARSHSTSSTLLCSILK